MLRGLPSSRLRAYGLGTQAILSSPILLRLALLVAGRPAEPPLLVQIPEALSLLGILYA
jgi:hypothetical protein